MDRRTDGRADKTQEMKPGNILDDAVKRINFIASQPFHAQRRTALCDKTGSTSAAHGVTAITGKHWAVGC